MQGKTSASPTPGGERTPLAQALPLRTPYLIQIFPAYACNFRCGYCLHALARSQHGFISDTNLMTIELFKKCIDDMTAFPNKVKMLRFAAIGEPLLHPNIAQMVMYAKKANIADSIDIVTNASLLTCELSDALLSAGLSRLRISIEGLSSEEYRKNANADIDFDKLVNGIKYFYDNCTTTTVYIKIIDYMVQDEVQKKRFYDIFTPICHSLAIEHLTPTIDSIDYDKISDGMSTDKPHNGEQLLNSDVCPQSFYMMQINPDGKIVPCCNMTYPEILGDANNKSLYELWRCEKYNDFRRNMLTSREKVSQVCKVCKLYRYDLHEADLLDDSKEFLLNFY